MKARRLEIEAWQQSTAFHGLLSKSKQSLFACKGQTKSRHETIGKEAGLPQSAQTICIFNVIFFSPQRSTVHAFFRDGARKELNFPCSSRWFFFRKALKPSSPTLPKKEVSLGVLNAPLYSLSMVP